MNEQELRQFLEKLSLGAYTNEEYARFVAWTETCSREEYQQMLILWEQLVDEREIAEAVDPKLIDSIERGLDKIDERKLRRFKLRTLWPRIAAAASILVILSVGGYFLIHKKLQQQIADNIIKPGTKKAILTLSNGQQINLSDAKAGALAQQGNTQIVKTADSQVVYHQQSQSKPAEIVYNTITTPRGGFYPLKMSDGSFALLDAQSSIRYPVNFTGDDRVVEITGQVYFEVKHDNNHPFKVKVKGQIIEDLGTVFNINAYDDEPVISTTLAEGSVRVTKSDQSATLQPGQQAITQAENNSIRVRKVNVDEVIAWKNGQTSFSEENIQQIMRQVSRWYDVDVRYEGNQSARQFHGGVARGADLNDLLKTLEFMESDRMRFTVEGRTIIVKPNERNK